MDAIWNGAQFISTPFQKHFSAEFAWGVRRPRLYQHTDLPYGVGLPMFCRNFTLAEGKNVTLYVSSLGCNDIYVNGTRVGSDEFKPGWTNYNKRVLYDTYDISNLVHPGENRILAVLAGGWYCGRIAGNYYGLKDPALLVNITEAGKSVCVTDDSWQVSVGGQIRISDIWDGELRDGSLTDYASFSLPDCELKDWKSPVIFQYDGVVTSFIGPHVRVRDTLSRKPATLTMYDGITYNGTRYGEIHICGKPAALPLVLKKGQTLVVDLAQEVVGWAKITVKSAKGNRIKIRYGEFLNDSGDLNRGNDGPKGSLYTINYRSALAKAYYLTNGAPQETYRPTFTFFGFRYIELSADEDFELLDFTAEVVGTDTRETGFIETSDALVNQLFSNTLWGQRSNYLSVPTDCPQRDERLGWTGDAQAFSVTAAYNADVDAFFHKWMQDARDSQSDEGAYPDIIPRVQCCTSENACAWGDAGVIIPYNMYRMFGDVGLIEEHYASMEKYIAQLVQNYGFSGPLPRFGDWLAYDWCPNTFISSAYFVHDLDLMQQMSLAIGKADRAEYYSSLRAKARQYFEDNFMENGALKGTTQTEKVISLAFNLISGDYARQVADDLVRQIRENDNRISTGFLGTYNICPTLSKFGKDKMAYTLLMQRKEPSWLYCIDQGATTIWERWNSYTLEKGFGDVGMNSFNHYAYGAVVEWMYRYMAGIEPGKAGFETLVLQPRVDTRSAEDLPDGQKPMKWVKAEFNSPKGWIRSAWSTENGFTYDCTVPCPTTLYLPKFSAQVLVNGVPQDMAAFQTVGDCAVIPLQSGTYHFEEM